MLHPEGIDRFVGDVLRNRHMRAIFEHWDALALPDGWLVAGCLFQTIWNLRSGAAHFGYPYPPLASARDGIDRFLVPATCVGLRPAPGGWELYAPNGLALLYVQGQGGGLPGTLAVAVRRRTFTLTSTYIALPFAHQLTRITSNRHEDLFHRHHPG